MKTTQIIHRFPSFLACHEFDQAWYCICDPSLVSFKCKQLLWDCRLWSTGLPLCMGESLLWGQNKKHPGENFLKPFIFSLKAPPSTGRSEHFLARCSLWALSAQQASREARGRSCCVPGQHGCALSQGDKGLLAYIHIPIHLMNALWPRRRHWGRSSIQKASVLHNRGWTKPSSCFAPVTSGQCVSNIALATKNLCGANLFRARHERKGSSDWGPNYKAAGISGKYWTTNLSSSAGVGAFWWKYRILYIKPLPSTLYHFQVHDLKAIMPDIFACVLCFPCISDADFNTCHKLRKCVN